MRSPSENRHLSTIFVVNRKTTLLLPVSPPSVSCCPTVCKHPCWLAPWYLLRPLQSRSSSTMGVNDDSEIIEHHVEEEMEKKGARSHAAASSSFPESVTPSDREGYSGTQSSHRLLAYSDALISIIATVMVRHPSVEVHAGRWAAGWSLETFNHVKD